MMRMRDSAKAQCEASGCLLLCFEPNTPVMYLDLKCERKGLSETEQKCRGTKVLVQETNGIELKRTCEFTSLLLA